MAKYNLLSILATALIACSNSEFPGGGSSEGSSSGEGLSVSTSSSPEIMTVATPDSSSSTDAGAEGFSNSSTTTGSSSSGTTSSSGGEEENPSKCGTKEEECLPTELDCLPTCVFAQRLVFVSSLEFLPSFAGSKKGAGELCTIMAQSAGYGGEFEALLLGKDGFWKSSEDFGGKYVLPSGTVVSMGGKHLPEEPLLHAIDENEIGESVVSVPVWTGYNSEYLLEHTCYSEDLVPWSGTSGPGGMTGTAGVVGAKWYMDTILSCEGMSARIYCATAM